MSFTVIPIHNLELPAGTRITFGKYFVLQDVPEWVLKDEKIMTDIGRRERQFTEAAKHAWVSEYYANSLGFPDPDWTGPKQRSIQSQRFQFAFLANMAIWLIQPSSVCFTTGFHALTEIEGGRRLEPPFIINTENQGPYWSHPLHEYSDVAPRQMERAAELYALLEVVPRKNAVWAALRAFSAALLSYLPDYRYPLFWQGLESLFTSDTKWWKVTERLRDRISYFLANNDTDQQNLSQTVDDCYAMRSRIIHGRWDEDPEIEARMADTENIVRTVIRHILVKPGMLEPFLSLKRDDFLEAWVQSKSYTPPSTY
jgi:hypothetical protein